MPDDYQRIANAIEFIRSQVGAQPGLAEVAAHVHLSEYHFQRLFSRWAGVTPKRYLQALTLSKAKTLLRERRLSSVAVSLELGLSSGSRLYDHFIQLEGVTPAEFKMQGRGLTIAYGFHPTPFGLAFIAHTARGICQLDFVDGQAPSVALEHLRNTWRHATLTENKPATAAVIATLFAKPVPGEKPLSLWVRGTNFQLNVWRALLNLKAGEVSSYRDIARAVGSPKATRAVGSAIGANPVALVIPCHRVLRQSGDLGGYRWGETRKHAILAREAARFEDA